MTRDDIIKHSLAQFLLHGIRKITMQQLVAPLGISTKTFYKSFNGKEDLLKACLLLHYAEIKRQYLQYNKMDMDPLTRLVTMLNKGIEEDFGVATVFYHDLNHYYPELQDKILAKGFKNYNNRMAQVISNGIAEGLFRPDTQPMLMADTINLLYRSLTRTDAYKKHKLNWLQLANGTLNTYIRGCCTPKGQTLID